MPQFAEMFGAEALSKKQKVLNKSVSLYAFSKAVTEHSLQSHF
jgi:hypothetical protein